MPLPRFIMHGRYGGYSLSFMIVAPLISREVLPETYILYWKTKDIYGYPLTPRGSGFYHNLSTVAVSYGYEHLNYTSDGTVFEYVRVDLYGLSGEPNPAHPEWDDFKSVRGSVAWAADARCQAAAGVQQGMAVGTREEVARSD